MTCYLQNKHNEHEKLKMRARIARYRNKKSMFYEIQSDCAMCAPTCVRVILCITTVRKCRVTKGDVAAAILQSGVAKR